MGTAVPGGTEQEWFAEIDLDPAGGWLRMGTRSLGDRPWLVVDDRREEELALKARLLSERPEEVFAARPGTEAAGERVLALLRAALHESGLGRAVEDRGERDVAGERHPLDRAGRLVQEDLCLLSRTDGRWLLSAASLCFPSRWRLAEKMGRSLLDVHSPVVGYRSALADRVDSMFDRLGDRHVWRRNWFIHPDPALFQPDRPVGGDPVVETDRCLDGLFLRSERQTVRAIGPDVVLFTIRIQQEPLRWFVADEGRREALDRFLVEAPDSIVDHRGLGASQRTLLRAALA